MLMHSSLQCIHQRYTRHVPKLTVPLVIDQLGKLYKPPRSFLNWDTPEQLLLATILSAQCTDDRVNLVTASLFKKYTKLQKYLDVPLKELEKDIFSCGHYHNKAKFLRGTAKLLLENHKGKVPKTMDELIQFPGVGRKTAAIVLWAAYGKIEGVPVDTHVLRLALRLGLTKHRDQHKVEQDLMKSAPKEDWPKINPLLISHGRAVCTARNRQCEKCVFNKECPSSKTRNRKDLAA